MLKIRMSAFIFSFIFMIPAFLHAGYYFEHENKIPNPMAQGKGGTQTKTVRSWVDGKKLKKENPLSQEMIIVDLDKNQVFGLNDKAKTYWSLKSKDYQKIATAQLFAMGVSMNPDGSITVPKTLFEASGKMKKIENRDAYEVKVKLKSMKNMPKGYKMSSSIWISEDVKLPKELLIDQLRISLNNPTGKEYKKLYQHWRNLDGYPVQTETIIKTPKGTIVSTETLKVYRKEKMKASLFRVPAGYKKVSDPIQRMQQMQKMLKEKQANQKMQLNKKSKKKNKIQKAAAKK